MKLRLFALAAASMAVATLSAQSPIESSIDSLRTSHKVIMFGKGEAVSSDSVQRVIDKFYYDQFRNSREPDVPYFMFMSKGGNFAMGIGGNFKARGWYDWGGSVFNNGFVTAEIPMDPSRANNRALNGSINGTNIFFRVLGSSTKIGDYQVYISAKWYGNQGSNFKISNAYATIGDWTVGYANTTFIDGPSQPFTVDSEGPNAEIGASDLLVRWMHTFKGRHVVAASLEMPNADPAASTDQYSAASQCMPNIAAFYQYQWASGQHVRLSGIMRFLRYRDLVSAENRTNLGWGVKLSTVVTPADGPVTLSGAAYYGKGIANLTNDLGGANLDLLGSDDQAGRMYAPGVFGCFAGVQYNFSPSVFASATVSELRFLPDGGVTPDTYRYGLYGAFNVGWYVTPRLLVAGEVDLGALKTMSMDKQSAHRAGIMAQLSF